MRPPVPRGSRQPLYSSRRDACIEGQSVAAKLARRECSRRAGLTFRKNSTRERFANFALRAEADTHDPDAANLKLSFLRKRSKIVEILAAKDMIFGLTLSGVCAAFSRETCERICFLNVTSDEVIRSLFHNKLSDSLITVSVYRDDNFSSLKCRTTPLEYVRRGQPDGGFALFESESLKWPGFVEFDDVNAKVLTYSALDKVYKVWGMTNYELLYRIEERDIQEIKISPGLLLLIYARTASHVPLKLLSIEDGRELSAFRHLLHRHRKVDFIEQFNEKLLIKQEHENLQILDVRTAQLTEVSRSEFLTPSAFIFLYENQLFLAFRGRQVHVWNFRGELVTRFEDHVLYHSDCNTNNIYISAQQDLILSYCRSVAAAAGGAAAGEPGGGMSAGEEGAIHISSIVSGKCIARVQSRQHLRDVTALFFNEAQNEIYTGNKHGTIQVWAN